VRNLTVRQTLVVPVGIWFNAALDSDACGAVSTFFDLTANLPENRLLRYACHILLVHHRTSGTPKRSVRSLAHFEQWLERAGVALERPDLAELPFWPDISQGLDRATRLARLIVTGQGIELPVGGSDVVLPSFLVDMESVFEKYVRHVLRSRLVDAEVLEGNAEGEKPLFDDRTEPPANPDVIIQRGPGDCPLVAEVKYKTVESRDDINQVLAYATVQHGNPGVNCMRPSNRRTASASESA